METKEDSIKMLEMRMRRQLNLLSGKSIRPENIQYYVSSSVLQRGEPQQEIHMEEEGELAQEAYEMQLTGQEMTELEEVLQQEDEESYGTVRSIEKEKEDFWQKLHNCRTKEEVKRVEEEYRQLERLGLSLMEDNAVLSVERKLEHTLFKDAKISAIREMTRQFIESDEYEKLPTDEEYILKFGELPQKIEYRKAPGIGQTSETKEVQHERARSGYENVRRSMDTEDSSGNVRFYSLNIKG